MSCLKIVRFLLLAAVCHLAAGTGVDEHFGADDSVVVEVIEVTELKTLPRVPQTVDEETGDGATATVAHERQREDGSPKSDASDASNCPVCLDSLAEARSDALIKCAKECRVRFHPNCYSQCAKSSLVSFQCPYCRQTDNRTEVRLANGTVIQLPATVLRTAVAATTNHMSRFCRVYMIFVGICVLAVFIWAMIAVSKHN